MDKDKKPLDVIDGGKPDGEPYEKKPPTPLEMFRGEKSIEISISRGGDTVRLLISDTASPQSTTGWNISDELKTALIKELRENYARLDLVDKMVNAALAMLQGVKHEDPEPPMEGDPF